MSVAEQGQTVADAEPTASGSTPVAALWRRLPFVQRGLLDDAVGGIASVAGGVRDSALQTVAGWARRMPGYELLCTVLGRDVVAGTPVPRSAVAIVNGFLGLMPRGDALRQQLQESGAIDRAGAWFEQEVPRLGLTWELIRGLFTRAWDALSAADLLDPEGAWNKISGLFGPPLARLRDFAVGAVTKVAEFVFEGVMTMTGGLGSQVMGVIRRAGDVFNQILRDPVGFAGNLVAAVRGGLGAFLSNIGTHLRNGLIGWLTGSLGGIIRLPAQFDLRGILGMAMEFLGLTWANIRGRIARLIGERAMGLLERGAGVVRDVAEHGIGALTGRIAQFTSGLVDTVLGGIREWVTNSVVGAAITRLISMFNPAGAVIQAIIAVYNTIQFFLERAQQLGALANSIFDSIAAIASGSIGNAVNAVENALGRAVPVVLGFLARLIGLGEIATPVRNVMTRVQTVIDSAIDRVVGWIAGLARRIGGAIRGEPREQSSGGPMPAGGPADGSVVATATTSAGGHNYEGRALVAGTGLRVVVQRIVLPAAPAAAASAATAPLPVREQLNRLVAKVERMQRIGKPVTPEDVSRINTMLRQVINEDLAAAASLGATSGSGLAAHVTEFNGLPAGEARRNAYYMEMVSWPTVTRTIVARDLSRIEGIVRRLAVGWVSGEDAIEDYLDSLYEIRIGSEDASDERIAGMPKYVPRPAFDAFMTAAAGIRRASRTGSTISTNSAARQAAVDVLCAAIRAGGFDVDHRTPLSRHWLTIGHRSTAEVRARIASDPDNLVAVSASWNRSKGGESYNTPPAAGFTRRPGETAPPPAPAGASGGVASSGILAPSTG